MSTVGSTTGLVGSTEVQIAYAVEKTARRVFKEQGDAALQLIQSAAEVAKSSQRQARPGNNGLGGRLDIRA
ncbi:MAG: hypothetical protein KDA21_13950 [Phycisphaerales bacterium]|nr:hypothetical protein [Phycisphaerales bacterium]